MFGDTRYLNYAIESEERQNLCTRMKLEDLPELKLAQIVENHMSNGVCRGFVRLSQEYQVGNDIYNSKDYLKNNSTNYVPTKREFNISRKLLVEKLLEK
jgi:hypothetical protein